MRSLQYHSLDIYAGSGIVNRDWLTFFCLISVFLCEVRSSSSGGPRENQVLYTAILHRGTHANKKREWDAANVLRTLPRVDFAGAGDGLSGGK